MECHTTEELGEILENVLVKSRHIAKAYAPEIILFISFVLAAGWFHNGANANHASRFDVMFTFVEPGPDQYTFRINQFVRRRVDGKVVGNTVDWANNSKYDSHRYSNKAPGLSLAGIPVYLGLYHLERALGYEPRDPNITYLNCWILNLILTVFPVALSAGFFYRFLIDTIQVKHRQLAWWLTIGLYFCTLTLPFSTQLWGHTTAMAFVVIGLYSLERDSRFAPILTGACLGGAVLCDYTAGIVLFVFLGLLAIRKQWPSIVRVGIGGLPVLVVYVLYHHICFGSSLIPASSFSNAAFLSKDAVGGLFEFGGVGQAMWGISFSSYRGLFWYMPVMFLFFPALVLFRKESRNGVAWASITICLGFFLLNLCFNGWHAGMSSGPRYLIVSFPFYFVLLAIAAGTLPKLMPRKLIVGGVAVLLLISFSNMFVISAVNPMADERREGAGKYEQMLIENPLKYYYRSVKLGMLQPAARRLFAMRANEDETAVPHFKVSNVGYLLGLRGGFSMVPVIAICIFLVLVGSRFIMLEDSGLSREDVRDQMLIFDENQARKKN